MPGKAQLSLLPTTLDGEHDFVKLRNVIVSPLVPLGPCPTAIQAFPAPPFDHAELRRLTSSKPAGESQERS